MIKNNIRSFRFTDEVQSVLERMPGENMSEKFDNLVHEAFFSLDDAREKKKRLEKEIQGLRQEISLMRERLWSEQRVKSLIENLSREYETYGQKEKM